MQWSDPSCDKLGVEPCAVLLPYQELGDACTDRLFSDYHLNERACVEGVCWEGACVAAVETPVGQACPAGGYCGDRNLTCLEDICTARVARGERCQSTDNCSRNDNLWCSDGMCVTQTGDGTPCDQGEPSCMSPLQCVQGSCQEVPSLSCFGSNF